MTEVRKSPERCLSLFNVLPMWPCFCYSIPSLCFQQKLCVLQLSTWARRLTPEPTCEQVSGRTYVCTLATDLDKYRLLIQQCSLTLAQHELLLQHDPAHRRWNSDLANEAWTHSRSFISGNTKGPHHCIAASFSRPCFSVRGCSVGRGG